MNSKLQNALQNFVAANHFTSKGKLSIALVVTRSAQSAQFPLAPENFVTETGTQVKGAGGAAIKKILEAHGIHRVLAKEGGRTNRGAVSAMKKYVAFLNDLHIQGVAEFPEIEKFWIERVHDFFAAKPLRLKLDPSHGMSQVVRQILDEALSRQRGNAGSTIVGTVLQHLVGAKLDLILASKDVVHHSASTSDEQTDRKGDFFIGDVAIHVTTAPSEALIQRCRENLSSGLRPLIVTVPNRVSTAIGLAENQGLEERVDVFDATQFLASNVYEHGRFENAGRAVAVSSLIERYNGIIEDHETDQGLKIEIK